MKIQKLHLQASPVRILSQTFDILNRSEKELRSETKNTQKHENRSLN